MCCTSALTQEQIRHVRFHLGGYRKSEICEIAERYGLLNARKKNSQDICFVPDGDYAGFLEHFTGRQYAPSDFVDADSNQLGQHRSIIITSLVSTRGWAFPLDIRSMCAALIRCKTV